MSKWRREASETLPELQPLIASRDIDSPMMLWIELNQKFENECETEMPSIDLLRRIWIYYKWCLEHGSADVQTGAALGFCEHLLDSHKRTEILPKIMTRNDFLGFKELLQYHNSPQKVDECLKNLW